MGLSGSAVRFVWLEVQKTNEAKYSRFFSLMEQIGRIDYSVAAKMAAVHELRRYADYKDVIVRLCESAPVEGPSGFLLKREFDLTAKYFGSQGRTDV